MKTISLATFKQTRKEVGSVMALVKGLMYSNIPDENGDRFIDAVLCDLGMRKLEKMKTKNLYDILDGYLIYHSEHCCSPVSN